MAASAHRIPVAKTYKLYIDGQFPRTESGRYVALKDEDGEVIANVCRGSRKDFRNAVVAARKAFAGWSSATTRCATRSLERRSTSCGSFIRARIVEHGQVGMATSGPRVPASCQRR